MHHPQIHILLEGLFERLLAQCFKVSNLRIYVLLRSLSPLNSVTAFSPKYLDITSPGKVFHLCHWNNSFLPSWHLNLKHVYSSLKRRIRSGLTRFLQSSYTIYPTVSEEQKYWKQAARGQKELQRSDARFAGTKVVRNLQLNALPPLVMYYVPALLPVYRDSSSSKPKKHKRPYLSAKTYRKWHWMVFPGSDHPTIKEASKLRNLYDPQDMQEILRISRMLPDNVIFPEAPAPRWTWTPKYQTIWQKWLFSKPPSQRT